MLRLDTVLVDGARAKPGDEALPDARVATSAQRVGAGAPAVEVPDHGDALRVRGPDREVGARLTAGLDDVSAKPVVELEVAALVEEIDVVVRQEADVVPD